VPCRNIEEIVSVGTSGGIGKNVENADINLTLSCIRLDKVVEVLFWAEVPVGADNHLGRELRVEIEKTVADLDVGVDSAIHATVPSFLAETKELPINLQKQGALSVDMGLPVLYILADQHRKKMTGTVRIGDLPLKGLPTWKSRSYKLQLKKKCTNESHRHRQSFFQVLRLQHVICFRWWRLFRRVALFFSRVFQFASILFP